MRCPQCNREIPDGSKFCTRCGFILPKKRDLKKEVPEEPASDETEVPLVEEPVNDVTTSAIVETDPAVVESVTTVVETEPVTPVEEAAVPDVSPSPVAEAPVDVASSQLPPVPPVPPQMPPVTSVPPQMSQATPVPPQMPPVQPMQNGNIGYHNRVVNADHPVNQPVPNSYTQMQYPQNMQPGGGDDTMIIYENKKKLHPMVWVAIGAGVVIILALAYLLLAGKIFEKGSSRSRLSYSDRDMEYSGSLASDSAYDYDTVAVVEEVAEDTMIDYSLSDRAADRPVSSSKVSVPDASYTSSLEAYDIYPSYVTDYKIGEDWTSADAVRNVLDAGGDYYYMSAEGSIDGYPIDFSAVKAPNNRIYGRYHNSNGTKLDVNGVQDASGNIIIKLAHGDSTSYWVLKPESGGHYSGTGTYSYNAEWGKKGKGSYVDIYFHK